MLIISELLTFWLKKKGGGVHDSFIITIMEYHIKLPLASYMYLLQKL